MSGLVEEALLLFSWTELSSALDSHLPSSSSSEEVLKAKTLVVSMANPSTDSINSEVLVLVLVPDEKVILLLLFSLEGE